MAIPVARVHLAMAHAALPGLLPSPPKCAMLQAPPCAAIILPNNSPPSRPCRADAAERWDAHKNKHGGGRPAPSSPPPSSAGSAGRASSSEKWVSNKKKKSAGAGGAASRSSSSSDGRADSEERWDAHKKPASPASSSSAASRNEGRHGGSSKRRATSRASSSSGERWDAHKNGRRAPRADGFVDDGGSSTGSNDVEVDMAAALPRAFYAGPGFIASPAPSMLPMPSFMVRVAA
ncbi:unnamed protein product [Urochloa decumbens]|uniref:Uncharacterized protein n=1 Tax=Urochloa decumbens TaxID=240449 RepID=A0ABC9B734_9POAL